MLTSSPCCHDQFDRCGQWIACCEGDWGWLDEKLPTYILQSSQSMHHRIACMRVCLYACGCGHVCEYVGVCAQVGLCFKFASTPVHGVRNSQAVILTAKAVTTGARAMLLIRKYFCTKHTQRASSHNMEPRRRKSLPWSASSKSLSSLAHLMQFCLPIT